MALLVKPEVACRSVSRISNDNNLMIRNIMPATVLMNPVGPTEELVPIQC